MTMSIDRAVIEQALGVLEKHVESFDYEYFTSVCELDPAKDTILILRKWLAEQAEQEPVAKFLEDNLVVENERVGKSGHRVLEIREEELLRIMEIYATTVQQAGHEPFDMNDHPPHRLCECRKCLEYFTDKAHKEALEHITDGSPCWCNPEMTYKDPSNGAEVWVHKELQMNNEEIIKAVKNSLNIYSFTAEALEMLIDNVKKEATVRTKDLTDAEAEFAFERGGNELCLKLRAVIAADREKNRG